jgi:hypothetical protein
MDQLTHQVEIYRLHSYFIIIVLNNLDTTQGLIFTIDNQSTLKQSFLKEEVYV